VLKPEEEMDAMAAYYPVPEGPIHGALPTRAPNATLAGKGLRESIRIVLSHYPTGLFPSDIATRLEEMGFSAKGNLSIAKRVYGELYRMRQKGIVSKRGHRYLMTEA
jgi:hypothetical protein